MPIRILAPEISSKIAAGEVMERPASVVKELVENSLDAGATQINIEVRGSGVNSLRVSDNGTGISSGEVEIAFHRYATSKLSCLDDLGRITSLGFRGEALPSIAAVAQVELLTRTAKEVAGTYLSLQNGTLVRRSTRGCPQGTIVLVRNLFRNVPARLKFLKSSFTESSHIADLATHFSLAFPEVRFTLTLDGREVLHTSGNGKLQDVLVEAYGLEVAQRMLRVKEDNVRGIGIEGYISSPSLTRTTRSYLSFFVNRRWVNSRLLSSAAERAYQGMLMKSRYPIGVLNISLPPQEIDVNVHPTKREVKFHQQEAVFNAVYKTVSQVLREQAPTPEIKPPPAFTSPPELEQTLWAPSLTETKLVSAPPSHAVSPPMPILHVLGQLATTYVIAEGPDGLYLIDQHAAHERVLFEQILAQQRKREVEVQGFLEPLTIELNPVQKEALNSKGEILAQFGFNLEPFGDRTYVVRAMPALLKAEKIAEVVREVLDSLEETSPLTKREEGIASSLACHSAIRAGQPLSLEEQRELVRQLEQTCSPHTCPHGRPTMIHLSSKQLEKGFGRI